MKWTLKLKDWQLFLLLTVLPLIFGLIVAWVYFKGFSRELTFMLAVLFVLVYFTLLYGWFWEMGILLFMKLPTGIFRSSLKFKISIFLSMISVLSVFLIFIGGFNSDLFTLIVFISILIETTCSLYVFYFISKSLYSVIYQRESVFKEYVYVLILFFILPAGVWTIQPAIEKIN